MKPLRQLRGACQHSDIATVIEEPRRGFGQIPSELSVSERFALDGLDDRSVPIYTRFVKTRTLEFLREVAQVITVRPSDCCGPASA